MPPSLQAENVNSLTETRSSFAIPENAVYLGRKRMDTANEVNNIPDFTFPAGFNPEEMIAYSSPLGRMLGSLRVFRVPSDGRAFGKFVGLITRGNNRYSEIQVKGVGGEPTIRGIQTYAGEKNEKVMPLEYGKRVFPLRFVTRAVKNVMGIYGFSAPPEITALDSDMSDQLSKAGLRTRALVYTAPFGPDVIFATDQKHQDQSESPNGKLVKTPSITKALGYTPGLEIWAIRCRYRLRDLLTNNNLLARVIGSGARNIVDYSNGYRPQSEPYHVRLKNHVVDSNRDSTDLYRDFDFLGGELLTRMSLDQDKRFTEIYDLFGKKVTEENRQRFWEEYTNKFSEILGEQIGILYSKGVFSRGGLMNPQNITLLAEIVDMDAMQVDINLKNDGPSVLNQLQLAIEPLADMLSKLYATGMLPEKIDIYGILRKFARGLLAKLSTEDKELITTVIEVERDKAMQSPKSEYETLRILNHNRSLLSSQDLLEKNQEQIELIEKSIVHSIIPLRQDQKFALAIDVTGDAAVSTVVDMLLAA